MRRSLIVFASSFFLVACNGDAETDQTAALPGADTLTTGMAGDTGMAGAAAGGTATAPVRDASGRDLGTLTLTEAAEGITLSGTLRGLPPGTNAIHIHMTGQCEPPFESAGGHWNPTNQQHGTENPQGPHFGDLPNLTVGADSTATVQATTPGGTLRGTNALLDGDGAAVVVHAGADDYRTDPAGGAGNRIACGVVSGA